MRASGRLWFVGSVGVLGACLALGCGDDEGAGIDAAGSSDGASADAPAPDAAIPDAPLPDGMWPPPTCDDFGDAGVAFDPDVGFGVPAEITRAFEKEGEVWVDRGPADWSCLGTPTADVPTIVAVTLSGTVEDFQTSDPVEGSVQAFAAGDFVTPVDTTTSGASGAYSLSLPAGMLRPAVLVSGEGRMDTYTVHIALASDQASQQFDPVSVSELTANALPAFIGITRTAGRALAIFEITDCNGRAVKNAIATVSSQTGCPVPVDDADTYYFSAGSTSLPIRHAQAASSNFDGQFMVIEMQPQAKAFVQVWGYVHGQTVGSDPIARLAELSIPLVADSFVAGTLEPERE